MLGLNSNVFAQNENMTLKQKSAISLNLSTLGIGGMFHWKLNKSISFRVGASKGNLNLSYNSNFNNNRVVIDTKFKLGMINLFADYYPKETYMFRITGGIARNYNLYNAKVIPATNQIYGYISYTPEQIGNIEVDVQGANLVPYLGFGFGNPVPRKKISLGADFGCFVHGTPKFKIISKGVFGPTNSEENLSVLTNAFKLWSLFPYMNVHVKYRIIN